MSLSLYITAQGAAVSLAHGSLQICSYHMLKLVNTGGLGYWIMLPCTGGGVSSQQYHTFTYHESYVAAYALAYASNNT